MGKRKKPIWPNFLVIGAGKCGTTSIDQYLKQHPQVFMSPVKEPNFFGLELKSENDFSFDEDELKFYLSSVTDIDSYQGLFDDVRDEIAIGEVSNTYLYHEDALSNIKKHVPHVKLIAIFRQPAERLYSRFLHLARDNRLPTEEFSDCLNEDSIWWQRDDLVKEGFYYKHLSKFYDHFDSSQIKVFLYENLRGNPQGMMNEIFEFIGVDKEFVPDSSVKFNTSGFVKNSTMDGLIGYNSWLVKGLKKIMPKRLFETIKNSLGIQKIVSNMRQKNLARPKLDEGMKNKLTAIYESDIRNLSKLINRDLSHWMTSNKHEQ